MAVAAPRPAISNIPIPDPSAITAMEIEKAKRELREDFKDRIAGLEKTINIRLDPVSNASAQSENASQEELTWRAGVMRQMDALVVTLADSIVEAETKAQVANDALQRLLEAAMAASTKLADVQFAAQEMAISKTETAIRTAMQSSQVAIDTARSSATSALADVDHKSMMRHDGAIAATLACELKLGERMVALQQLIDLRAKMNEIAVEKANEANEKRFQSVNEFRDTLSDQARDFVTVPVLNARTGQIDTQMLGIERQMRADATAVQNTLSSLSARLDRSESAAMAKREARTDDHTTIGSVVGIIGGVVAGISLVAVLIFGIMSHQTATVAANPTIGADTRRADDLVSRLNELTARLNPAYPPVAPPGK